MNRRRSPCLHLTVFLLVVVVLPLLVLLASAYLVSTRKDELFKRFVVHVLQHKIGRGALRNAHVSLGSASVTFGGAVGADGVGGGGGDDGRRRRRRRGGGEKYGGSSLLSSSSSWTFELRQLRIDNVPRRGYGYRNPRKDGIDEQEDDRVAGCCNGRSDQTKKDGDGDDDDNTCETDSSDGEDDDGWSSPYAIHLEYLRLTVSGPAAFLSGLQIPIAAVLGSPSLPRAFASGLDFVMGYRVKSIDVLEVVGLRVYLEDDDDNDDGDAPNDVSEGGDDEKQVVRRRLEADEQVVVRKRGRLRKIEPHQPQRRPQEFDFVLEPSKIVWYKPSSIDGGGGRGEAAAGGGAKPRGTLQLYPSSSVEVVESDITGIGIGVIDKGFEFDLISDTDVLTLRASSIDERDAWTDALGDVIAELTDGRGPSSRGSSGVGGGGGGNAPWIRVLAAESHARKTRWRQREWRQRTAWERRWRPEGDGESSGDNDGNGSGSGSGSNNAIDGESNEDKNSASNYADSAVDATDQNDDAAGVEGGANLLAGLRDLQLNLGGKGKRSNDERERRFEDALEWRIGRLTVRGWALHVHGRHLALDDDVGWSMTGFVGSGTDLKRRLHFGLLRKMIQDSVKSGIFSYTGKEEYVFGDLTKTTAKKVGGAVAARVSDYIGKEEYSFGDVTKTTVDKVGDVVAAGVCAYTGKDEYAFGDVTRTTAHKVGGAVAAGVKSYTGKEKYHFGDVTRTTVDKVRRILAKD